MLVSIPQAAPVWRVPERTLRYWVWQDRVKPSGGTSSKPLFDLADLDRLVRTRRA